MNFWKNGIFDKSIPSRKVKRKKWIKRTKLNLTKEKNEAITIWIGQKEKCVRKYLGAVVCKWLYKQHFSVYACHKIFWHETPT